MQLIINKRTSSMPMEKNNISGLYQYLDSLFEQDVDSDTLFASSYVRGFISLAASDQGDEQQMITALLVDSISEKLAKAKIELSPQDQVIVQNFWLSLQQKIDWVS